MTKICSVCTYENFKRSCMILNKSQKSYGEILDDQTHGVVIENSHDEFLFVRLNSITEWLSRGGVPSYD